MDQIIYSDEEEGDFSCRGGNGGIKNLERRVRSLMVEEVNLERVD